MKLGPTPPFPAIQAGAVALALLTGPFAHGALVAYWTFDDTNIVGTVVAADVVGGNNLTPTGAGGGLNITPGQVGLFGQAYAFVRDADPVVGAGADPTLYENLLRTATPATPAGNAQVTISLWFNQTVSAGQNKIFGYGTNNVDANATTGEAMDIGLEAGGIRLRNYNGNALFGSGFDFTPTGADAGWHHLAVRVNSGATTYNDVNIFLDGGQLTAVDNGALTDTLNLPSSLLGVGNVGYNDTLNNGFTGLLDELRIYDTALSNVEIQALAVPPPMPAVAKISAFNFTPQNRVPAGSAVTLSWSLTNATVATLNPGNLDVLPLTTNGSGSLVVNPAVKTTYTLSVSNSEGSFAQASRTIHVGTNGFPNIIFFLLDDFGWADWQQNGAPDGSVFFETPRMNQLAAEGKWFRHGYAACNVCSPTRASILTGKIPAYNKVTQWISGTSDSGKLVREATWVKRMELSETTIAEILQAAGYRTVHVGKWHLGQASGDPEANPLNQGFDVNIGGNHKGNPGSFYFADASGSFDLPNLGPGTAPQGTYLTDFLTVKAREQITQAATQGVPLFMYFAHYAVHTPLAAPAATVAKYNAKLNSPPPGGWLGQSNPTYAAMIEHVDKSLGALIDLLHDPDGNPLTDDSIADNTLIVFTSDNGGLLSSTSNRPLRKGKGGEYEGGTREPVVFWWPGKIAPGTVSDEPMISYDYYPTFLSVAELPGDPAQALQGQDLSPLVFDSGSFQRTTPIVFHYPHYSDQGGKPYSALRRGNYKSVYLYESAQFELYNVVADRSESTNLALTFPDLNAVLSYELANCLLGVDANYPRNVTTLAPLPPTPLVSMIDTDNDGQNDLAEVIAGTAVNDSGSTFRADVINGSPVVVSVVGKAGRQYQLETTGQLTPPSWTNILTTATLPANQTLLLPDTNAPANPDSRLYRVGVSIPFQ